MQGEAVTSGLRKVTDDMKTKNRADRTGAVPANSASNKGNTATNGNLATATPARTKPPSKELVNRRWVIEYFNGDESLVLEAGEVSQQQSVYVTQCSNCVIQVRQSVCPST